MIPKSVQGFSEKIMLKQEAKAGRRFEEKASRLSGSSLVRPGLRHQREDEREAHGGDAREAHERYRAAEVIADIAREHGRQRGADAGPGPDDAERKVEPSGAARDIGDDDGHDHGEN